MTAATLLSARQLPGRPLRRLVPPGRFSAAACMVGTATASNVLRTTRSLGSRVIRPQTAFIGKRKPLRMQSLFGVGAPEAILVGVVALVVFGPKGLAEAARGVGKMLRSFQPTIREVVEVSRDLQSTLKQELGLDELKAAARGQDLPLVPPPSTPKPLTSTEPGELRAVDEATAQLVDPDIEAKRAQAAAMAWGAQPRAALTPAAPAKDLQQLSMEDLEAELARRRAASTSKTTDAAPKA